MTDLQLWDKTVAKSVYMCMLCVLTCPFRVDYRWTLADDFTTTDWTGLRRGGTRVWPVL